PFFSLPFLTFIFRLRSSSLLDVYWLLFRPVGDFTFSKPVEKVSKILFEKAQRQEVVAVFNTVIYLLYYVE
ncbi:hypothetical protein, partial [Psychromonas aquatilis]